MSTTDATPFPSSTRRRGCFPGSFDPPTVAHLAIADAAREQCSLERIDLVLSRVALGKTDRADRFRARLEAVLALARPRPWLEVTVTDAVLVADLAEGYDTVILGADKWEQLHDVRWYPDGAAGRDAALARLPPVALAARAGAALPDPLPASARVLVLPTGTPWEHVSSTAVRDGARHWAADAAD